MADKTEGNTKKSLEKWGDIDDTTTVKNDKKEDKGQDITQSMDKMELKGDEQLQMLEDDYEAELEIQQNDPKSNLFSALKFEDLKLPEDLLKGVYAMKYHKPSRIQSVALPMILGDPPENVIGQAQSGSGKTATFALGMLYRVQHELNEPQAICVAPSRELATQILDSVKSLGQFTKTTYCLAVPETKDVVIGQKITQHIVVGTPGYIENLMKRRTLNTDHIKIFVLDEADFMVEEGNMRFRSVNIKRNIRNKKYQTLLFSATFAPEVQEFAEKMVPEHNIITVKREQLTLDGIKQYWMECKTEEDKYKNLSEIFSLMTIGKCVIFVQTRETCKNLTRRMREEGHSVGILHGGDMLPSVRDNIIKDFRMGVTKTLITTNVLARGIDVLGITLVINFDLPITRERTPDYEAYLHRIGRTGRFGRKGCAINFVYKDLDIIKSIEKYYEREIVQLPNDDVEELEKVVKNAVN